MSEQKPKQPSNVRKVATHALLALTGATGVASIGAGVNQMIKDRSEQPAVTTTTTTEATPTTQPVTTSTEVLATPESPTTTNPESVASTIPALPGTVEVGTSASQTRGGQVIESK